MARKGGKIMGSVKPKHGNGRGGKPGTSNVKSGKGDRSAGK